MDLHNPPDQFFKSIKVPLRHVLKNPKRNQKKITNAVMKSHKIVIHTLQFLKLYLLDYYDTNHSLPVIDKQLINSCMKIQCNEVTTGRPPKPEIQKLKETLKTFYDNHYSELKQDDDLDYNCMNTILDYLTISILTMFETNIKQHYVEYVERYVNVMWKKKEQIDTIREGTKEQTEKDTEIKELCNQLRRVKNDLLNIDTDGYKSNIEYHLWIHEQKECIVPIKDHFEKNNLKYDLQCSPQDYLPCMIYMMKIIEDEEVFINNVFPLRSNIIPKHIRIDTTTVVQLLLTPKFGTKMEFLTKGNLKRREDEIWQFFFRTNKDCFHKNNYSFHHMIETDGISCSILMIRSDKIGRKVRMSKEPKPELYINELEHYDSIKDKKIVAIDPGKCDLLYCVDGDGKEANKFRYCQDQRRKELKVNKYKKIQLDHKQEKINGKTIIEYETELSEYNKKTLNIQKFKQYIKKKNEMNSILFTFYEKELYRKLKLNTYLNTLKSEQRMLTQFKKKFGNKEEVIVCFGDYEQKQHMKFKEPIKGKGMRTLFRRNGFRTYLVDEFRTSCKCSNCEGGECEKFLKRKISCSESEEIRTIHGLLRCKTCGSVWNRDCNGAKNIYKIAGNSIKQIERPSYLSRNRGVVHNTSKPKFTCPEMDKPSDILERRVKPAF